MNDEEPMQCTTLPLRFIRSTLQCSSVTLDHMWEYYAGERAVIHQSALAIYREGWIVSALGAKEDSKTFIQMLVRAEMKKSNRYHVHVVLDRDGTVDGAHCECAAGGWQHSQM